MGYEMGYHGNNNRDYFTPFVQYLLNGGPYENLALWRTICIRNRLYGVKHSNFEGIIIMFKLTTSKQYQ
jgi:hypothetical protein